MKIIIDWTLKTLCSYSWFMIWLHYWLKSFSLERIELRQYFIVFEMEEVIGPRLYGCSNCRNHVALHDDGISKAFQVNTTLGLSFNFIFCSEFYLFTTFLSWSNKITNLLSYNMIEFGGISVYFQFIIFYKSKSKSPLFYKYVTL